MQRAETRATNSSSCCLLHLTVKHLALKQRNPQTFLFLFFCLFFYLFFCFFVFLFFCFFVFLFFCFFVFLFFCFFVFLFFLLYSKVFFSSLWNRAFVESKNENETLPSLRAGFLVRWWRWYRRYVSLFIPSGIRVRNTVEWPHIDIPCRALAFRGDLPTVHYLQQFSTLAPTEA